MDVSTLRDLSNIDVPGPIQIGHLELAGEKNMVSYDVLATAHHSRFSQNIPNLWQVIVKM